MPLVAFLVTTAYALVNAFGAWLVSRRKPWVAGLFMVSAVILVVAAAAFISNIPYTRVILAAGLVYGVGVVLSQRRNRDRPGGLAQPLFARACVAVGIFLLGELAVRYPF